MASAENPNSETTHSYSAVASVESEFLDSDVCGKRKTGREIQEITKIDSGGCDGSAMAKANAKEKAKASREVLELEDTYGIFDPFKEEMIFEREDFDPLSYVSSDDDEWDEVKETPYDREAVLKYTKQVRDSFGFDVDVSIPRWLEGLRYFLPLNLSDPCNRGYIYKKANLVIDEINSDMNSKTYELVEVVKSVWTIRTYSLMFLTLTAKKVGEAEADVLTIQAIVSDPRNGPVELHQWRFKPVAPAPAENA